MSLMFMSILPPSGRSLSGPSLGIPGTDIPFPREHGKALQSMLLGEQ